MKMRLLLSWPVLALALTSCGFVSSKPDALIAVASNFTATADLLEEAFEAAYDFDVDIVSGATGQLYAQITNGAPFDVFLAADVTRPLMLEEAGLIVDGSRFTYAVGALALWTANIENVPRDDSDIAAVLLESRFQSLAIANPDLAPYGAAAMQALETLGLIELLEDRIVRGANIGQVFALVSTGSAEFGFVAQSQITTAGSIGWSLAVPAELHDPILQDGVLLQRAAENDAARAFIAFLRSSEGHDIIERHDYRVPE